MDKILAFSILSSSPADLAAGRGYYSTRLSWRTTSSGGNQKQQPEKQDKAEQKHQSSHPVPERKKQEEGKPRFAPEFDGLNCFESIVSF
ncbi:hypothetical protein PR202_ga18267 [Eleusine coracana subsp. coracana]|uniref:Uncharacterized protein n=1 Tax=Eleusine coracana subsp. coracana TaxID=191504 RepID=A0AAV5CRD3_ELECO|nr:hypothetical protein QOZ80_6AG0507510 [Eleusine coracana subsp. coracana]GJN01033.1 hypothetical protein PR202_ga18267 [Eleusine coracana subsp. coracana]